MRMRAKDELTKLECNEGCMTSSNEEFRRGTNPIWQLGIPVHPFLQLGLHGLFLWVKLKSARINIANDGQEQLICYIFQSHGDLTVGEKESVSGGTPLAEVKDVPIVR